VKAIAETILSEDHCTPGGPLDALVQPSSENDTRTSWRGNFA
jgi:hypothetical protein